MDDIRADLELKQQVQDDTQHTPLKAFDDIAEVEVERIEAEKIRRLIEG